jgi:hypothetical protein
MTKRSSAKVSKATNNITTDSSSSSSVNPSSNDDNNNNISTANTSIQRRSQVVVRQISNTNINHEDNFDTASKVSYKRKQAPTKNLNNKKIPKMSINNTTTASSITIISDADDTDDPDDNDDIDIQQVKEPSPIWQYATRSNDRSYAICSLCNRRISTANWSTTSVRRHLVQVHNKIELMLPNEGKRKNPSKISQELKEKLHKLSVEAIIRDNLPFTAFHKSGLSNLIQEAVPGMKEFLFNIFYTKKAV